MYSRCYRYPIDVFEISWPLHNHLMQTFASYESPRYPPKKILYPKDFFIEVASNCLPVDEFSKKQLFDGP